MRDPRSGVKPSTCPFCGKTLDAATCFTREDVDPKPGDLTICSGCEGLLAFDHDGSLIVADDFKGH